MSGGKTVWPVWAGIFFLLAIVLVWLPQQPSREEAFGDTAKLWDLHRAAAAGWTPNYMLGHSPVMLNAVLWGVAIGYWVIALLGGVVGGLAATKLLAVAYIALSGWTMTLLLGRLGLERGGALLGGLLYMVLPSINVRLGMYEHFGVGPCFVFVPLILRGILAVAEERSPKECVALGLSAAGLALSYTKIAIVAAPLFVILALEAVRQQRPYLKSVLACYGWSLVVAGFSGVLILIPAVREFGFAAGFLFDPLDGWQHHYAFKTPLLLIDLWGFFTKGGDQNLTGDAQMFWVGIVPIFFISLAASLSSLAEWRSTRMGRWFLILSACWLISLWFASGPDGLLLGHLGVLKTGQGLPDTSIPLLWLSLIWMGWIIYRISHQLFGNRQGWEAALITLIVLVIPVFRIVNHIPLFNDVRAPESYWSVAGYSCLVGAVAIALWGIFKCMIPSHWTTTLALLVAVIMTAELYPVYSAYWTRGMEKELFTDFDQAANFLKTAPIQGRVHPLSGRYFYLTLPEKSGRGLDSESAWRHFQLKWVRHLEVAGNASGDTLRSYLNLAGVAYIFLDKEDPFSPKQMQDFFRSVYPVVFENRYFAVLANSGTLYPGFMAHDFVSLPTETYALAPAVLQLLPKSLITVETPQVADRIPGFAGQANGSNQIALLPQYQSQNGQPFVPVPLVGNRMDDYQRMRFQVSPQASGWLVVTEAYHPDWIATIDGKPAQTTRAEAALLGTYVPTGSHDVTFQFHPPGWYRILILMGFFTWLLGMFCLVFMSTAAAPKSWKDWWTSMK
jgi:hypothetical protein